MRPQKAFRGGGEPHRPCSEPHSVALLRRAFLNLPTQRMNVPRLIVSAAVACLVATSSAVAENSVLYWNQQALDATRLARNPPPMSSFFFSAFHAAIFDAANG